MGSMKSTPASSSIWASLRLSSHVAFQRSSTFVTVMPPEQFVEKVPNRKWSLSSKGRILFLLFSQSDHEIEFWL
jgi:hypothetical protein